jgi:hypothetical protein
VWRVPDAIEDVEFDQILPAGDQKRQRLFGIEPGGSGGQWNKALEVAVGTGFGRDRLLDPARYLGPDKKRGSGVKALRHLHRTIRADSRQSGLAIGDRDFAAQLLDRADAIEVRALGERLQIECGGELAVHDRVTLCSDEPEIVTRSADHCRTSRAGGAAGGADAEFSTCSTATDGQARR